MKTLNYKTNNKNRANLLIKELDEANVIYNTTEYPDGYIFEINYEDKFKYLLEKLNIIKSNDNVIESDNTKYITSSFYYQSKDGENIDYDRNIYSTTMNQTYFNSREDAFNYGADNYDVSLNRLECNNSIIYEHFGFMINKVIVDKYNNITKHLDTEIYRKILNQ